VNVYYVAAIWLGMALLASMVSIWIAVPAALVEIVIGVLAGNIPGLLFRPTVLDTEEEEALGEEDLSVIHHPRSQPHAGSPTSPAVPSRDPADPSSR
jgi:hypothetical protein